MFRVVTSQVPTPLFWFLCDARDCSQMATGAIPVAFPIETQEAATALQNMQAQFFQAAGQLGWMLGFDGQFCPEHARQMRTQHATERRLVEIANVIPGAVRALKNGGNK